MSGRYLLDTSVAIRVLEQEVDLEARRGSGLEAFLCLTVVGELLFGAERSGRPEANRARVDGLLAICPVIGEDLETARRYAALKVTLRRLGRPIPENDLWIAASALRHGLVLATRDAHFDHVEGLALESW
jgi:tRNA(fMet)-specific endonuclease VapC